MAAKKKQDLPAHIEEALQFEPQKVFVFFQEDTGGWASAFGVKEYEIDPDVFKKHAVLKEQSQPDIFARFITVFESKMRELFKL